MRKIYLVLFLLFVGPSALALTRIDDMIIDSPAQNRAAALLDVKLWEDGILPLQFDQGITDSQKDMLKDACAQWGKVAKVKCIEGAYKNRVLFVSAIPGGCWSLWGMGFHIGIMGRQMNLAQGCWDTGVLLHELGHAFGLIHEHQRPDRDKYITIDGSNVGAGFLGLQMKVNFNYQDSVLKTDYDFLSIMHYPNTAFSKNGKETIIPKPGYEKFRYIMGRTGQLSARDAQLMNQLYK